MDIGVELILLAASIYFAKEEYERSRYIWAMAWASLIGWNVHTLLGLL